MPVQTEYFALEGLAGLLETLALVQRELNPRLTVAGMLLTMHDNRTRLGPRCRARGQGALPRPGLRHGDPPQRACGRGAELRAAGDPPRSPQRGRGGVFRAGKGGRGAWLSGRPRSRLEDGGEPTQTRNGQGPRGDPVRLGRAQGRLADELRELPVELISPNPKQPRRRFDQEALTALAGSLGERGVLQPVLVRPKAGGTYELIAGERRWRAAQIAGLEVIPALVREREDAEALELALIENMAREDLNPIEEARACAALVEELALTREQVGTARGPQPRGRQQSDAAARPPRRGDRAAGAGRAERGARPGAAAGRGPRRAPQPRARGRRRGLVGADRRSARAPEQRRAWSRARAKKRRRARARESTPISGRRAGRSPRRSARRWAPRCA